MLLTEAVLKSAQTQLEATSAPVGLDTHWTLITEPAVVWIGTYTELLSIMRSRFISDQYNLSSSPIIP